jgi:hypothetical protein
LFHGPSQKNVSAGQALFGQRATLVPITRAGKNALDFHLSFYMGYIASRSPQANFVVISNDKGYLPMLEHAQSLGFSARQIGFVKAKGAAKKAAAKKIGVKTATKTVTTAQTVAVSARQKAARSAPVKKAVAAKKMQAGKQLIEATAKQAPQGLRPAPAKKTATAKKTPKAKAVAGNGKSAPTRPTKTPSIKTKAPDIQNKPGLAWDLDKAVRHVQASLRKSANKPSRKASLLAAIKSLLNEPASNAAIVTDVLAQLVSRGFVLLDEKGGVHFSP